MPCLPVIQLNLFYSACSYGQGKDWGASALQYIILPSLLRTTNNLIASRSTFPRLLANSINGSTAMRGYSWICSDVRSILWNKQQVGVVCCPGLGVGVCIASCTEPEGGIEDATWMDEPLVPSPPLLASHRKAGTS